MPQDAPALVDGGVVLLAIVDEALRADVTAAAKHAPLNFESHALRGPREVEPPPPSVELIELVLLDVRR
jgi:hypothetical protein